MAGLRSSHCVSNHLFPLVPGHTLAVTLPRFYRHPAGRDASNPSPSLDLNFALHTTSPECASTIHLTHVFLVCLLATALGV